MDWSKQAGAAAPRPKRGGRKPAATAESSPPTAETLGQLPEQVRDRIVEFVRIDPAQIELNPDNYRTHDDAQRRALRELFARVGLVDVCVVYARDDGPKPYRLIDGELRTTELAQPVPCVVVDVDDDEAALLLATMDPLSAMAGVHDRRLRALLERPSVTPASDGLAELLARQRIAAAVKPADDDGELDVVSWTNQGDLAFRDGDIEAGDDEATLEQLEAETETLRARMADKWGTAVGQVWAIGPHRLVVGDCANGQLSDVVRQVSGGQLADLVWTDPPYGIAYASRGNDNIVGDKCQTAIVALFNRVLPSVLAVGKPFYVCGSSPNIPLLFELADGAGCRLPSLIIWNKCRLILRRQDYHSGWELVFYSWREWDRHSARGKSKSKGAAPRRWYGDRKQVDLWSVPSLSCAGRRHINEKPVELPERAIVNSSPKGGIVCDPFAGSGSGLVAAARRGRVAVGGERDPGNAGIILEWLAEETGDAPELMAAAVRAAA